MDKWFLSVLIFFGVSLYIIITLPFLWYWKIIIFLAAYFFIIFFLSRLVVPFLGFKKYPLPKEVPLSLQEEIDKLKLMESKKDVLREAYTIITTRFFGGEFSTFSRMSVMMTYNIDKLWNGKFAQCTIQNYFLRTLLVGSEKFSEDDIHVLCGTMNCNIHQALGVNLGKKWIIVDPWADCIGNEMGKKVKQFFPYSLSKMYVEL